MPRRLNRAVSETALETALFGVDWDASVCEQRLAALAKAPAGSAERTNHLVHALDAFQGARASFDAAVRILAASRTRRRPVRFYPVEEGAP